MHDIKFIVLLALLLVPLDQAQHCNNNLNNIQKQLSQKEERIQGLINTFHSLALQLKNFFLDLDLKDFDPDELIQKVKTHRPYVPIVAPLKSGKSTLMDALIGLWILPTSGQPQTAIHVNIVSSKITRLIGVHTNSDQYDVLHTDVKSINNFLSEWNSNIRDKNMELKWKELRLETPVAMFMDNGIAHEDAFSLVDAPGPEKLAPIIQEEFWSSVLSKADAFLVVLDARKLKSGDEMDIFNAIIQQDSTIASEIERRLFLILNVFDTVHKPLDETLPIKDLPAYIANYARGYGLQLEPHNIHVVNAQAGLLARLCLKGVAIPDQIDALKRFYVPPLYQNSDLQKQCSEVFRASNLGALEHHLLKKVYVNGRELIQRSVLRKLDIIASTTFTDSNEFVNADFNIPEAQELFNTLGQTLVQLNQEKSSIGAIFQSKVQFGENFLEFMESKKSSALMKCSADLSQKALILSNFGQLDARVALETHLKTMHTSFINDLHMEVHDAVSEFYGYTWSHMREVIVNSRLRNDVEQIINIHRKPISKKLEIPDQILSLSDVISVIKTQQVDNFIQIPYTYKCGGRKFGFFGPRSTCTGYRQENRRKTVYTASGIDAVSLFEMKNTQLWSSIVSVYTTNAQELLRSSIRQIELLWSQAVDTEIEQTQSKVAEIEQDILKYTERNAKIQKLLDDVHNLILNVRHYPWEEDNDSQSCNANEDFNNSHTKSTSHSQSNNEEQKPKEEEQQPKEEQKPKEEEQQPKEQLLEVLCPEYQFGISTTECLHFYTSVVAVQASYHEDPQKFIDNDLRPIARFLKYNLDCPGTDCGDTAQSDTGEEVSGSGDNLSVFYCGESVYVVVHMYKNGIEEDVKKLMMAVGDLTSLFPTAGYGSSVHRGIWAAAQKLDTSIVRKLLRTNKDVIITGHSINGVIAHAFLLRILSENNLLPYEFANRIKSIAFGAPMIGTENLAQSLKEDDYSDRFVTFVNKGDFMPRIFVWREKILIENIFSNIPYIGKLFLEPLFRMVVPELRPIGTYYFLEEGRVHQPPDSRVIQNLHQQFSSNNLIPWVESYAQSEVSDYAKSLEVLKQDHRAKSM